MFQRVLSLDRKRFGKLLGEGISSVAERQDRNKSSVKEEIGGILGYSVFNIDYWLKGNIPSLEVIEVLFRYCASHGRLDRLWAESFLTKGGYPNPGQLVEEYYRDGKTPRVRLFMAYDHRLERDSRIVENVRQALESLYEISLGSGNPGDDYRLEYLSSRLALTNFLIVFLSRESIHNEMILWELEKSYQLGQSLVKGPAVLPVRILYGAPFPAQLQSYLTNSQGIFWQSEEDTARVIEALKSAIATGKMPQAESRQFEMAEDSSQEDLTLPASSSTLEMETGTMKLHSPFYIERESDQIALRNIQSTGGVTMTIKGARQTGKSSLLVRVSAAAEKSGKRVSFLDFQRMHSSLKDIELFFRQFCTLLSDSAGLEDRIESYWSSNFPLLERCSRYVSRYVLEALEQPLVLALDEVDSIFEAYFRDDFFGMLRSWHNSRAKEQGRQSIWEKLDLVLVTSTEPYLFIEKMSQSPFNVGERIEMQDFSVEQVADLDYRYGSTLLPVQVADLMELLHGHPFLTQRALYLIATGRIEVVDLFRKAATDDGPFSDHLHSLLIRLLGKDELIQGLRQALQEGVCSDYRVYLRLQGAGLLRSQAGRAVPRCRLYGDFFREHLNA
jgi:hypothetical protein